MTSALLVVRIFIGCGVALWLVSLIVEAMRPIPATPTTLGWAPEIPIRYINVGNCRLRYINAGTGPNLVLLHTLRTLARSSFLGRLSVTLSDIPVVGETFTRLRNFLIVKAIFEGGVVNPKAIPIELLREMYSVGNRPGHYRAFLSLLRNSETWERASKVYANINVPALLIWGDQDWSTPREREDDRRLVPGTQTATVQNGGHFLPLDCPGEVQDLIIRFAGG